MPLLGSFNQNTITLKLPLKNHHLSSKSDQVASPPDNYAYKAGDKRRPFTSLNGFAVQPHNQILEIELAESLC